MAANEYRGWTSSYRLCRHPIAAALPIATPIGIAIGLYLSTLAPQAVRGETVRGTAFFTGDPRERAGVVEYDETATIFTRPADQRTNDSVTGRFG